MPVILRRCSYLSTKIFVEKGRDEARSVNLYLDTNTSAAFRYRFRLAGGGLAFAATRLVEEARGADGETTVCGDFSHRRKRTHKTLARLSAMTLIHAPTRNSEGAYSRTTCERPAGTATDMNCMFVC